MSIKTPYYCKGCNRKIFEYESPITLVEIKCYKCKEINILITENEIAIEPQIFIKHNNEKAAYSNLNSCNV
jgi:phage FluMu protein Com